MGELTDESGYDADTHIDYTPPADPAAVLPTERAPTWLAASVAVTLALLLGVALAVRPAQAVSHGAIGGRDRMADETPTHQDLFRLPAWRDDAKPAEPSTPAVASAE